MVLETLDVKKNDIFIYSENRFKLNDNFRIIYKDAVNKAPRNIHFNKVIEEINNENPKSLIIYRLLTNCDKIDVEQLKYGVPIYINGMPEIIYFDPIFAMKELEDVVQSLEVYDIRFRIQQVGLASSVRTFGKNNFTEIYSFDLSSTEAKWQNDKVYAEIIFINENIDFNNVTDSHPDEKEIDKKITKISEEQRTGKTLENEVEEDKAFDPRDTKKLTEFGRKKSKKPRYTIIKGEGQAVIKHVETTEIQETKPEIIEAKTEASVEKISPFGEFLKRVKSNSDNVTEVSKVPSETKRMIQIFKTSASIENYVLEREGKKVVLKIKK